MMHKRLETDALGVLRTCFDLADVGLAVSADLLERLLDLDRARLAVLTAHLRQVGLLQPDRYGLTIVGLAIAAASPQSEPRPMTARAPRSRQGRSEATARQVVVGQVRTAFAA